MVRVRLDYTKLYSLFGYFSLWIVGLVLLALLRPDLHPSWEDFWVMVVFPAPFLAVYALTCFLSASLKVWMIYPLRYFAARRITCAKGRTEPPSARPGIGLPSSSNFRS